MASIQRRPARGGQLHYRVQVRLRGAGRSATFPTLHEARQWGAITEGTLRAPRGTPHREAVYHTLGDLRERYAREVLPSKSPGTQAHQGPQLAWWTAQLGRLRLDQVTPARLATWKERLAETRAPATVNRYLAALSHAFTLAVSEWEWLETSPMHGQRVRRLREPRGRVRCLTDEERPRLLTACQASHNRFLYPVVLLALSTGARKQEILDLTWWDIDLRRAFLTIAHSKNGERRTLPLVGLALGTVHSLARVRRIDTPLLFPRADGRAPLDLRYAFQQALREAGIADFRFHDLRHTFASRALETCPDGRDNIGRHMLALTTYMGHARVKSTYWYVSSTPQLMGDIAQACEAFFQEENA